MMSSVDTYNTKKTIEIDGQNYLFYDLNIINCVKSHKESISRFNLQILILLSLRAGGEIT